jgi:multicomponent K+:H+ antiporter subunit D
MDWAGPHLIVAPVLVPLVSAAVMLLVGDGRRTVNAWLNVASTLGSLAVAVALVRQVHRGGTGAVGVYLPSNWDVPFGILLVADRLSALLVLLTAVIATAALLFAVARWHRAGVYFHPLFQLQLMGVNGAFLTADLFNLFVFFEVMLAASYGLLLHASGRPRVRAGMHYVAVNLVASSLFLIGVAIMYGITGTLNLADMARKIPMIPDLDRGLLHAGAAILAIAFLTKAAVWPLNFWLTPAYAAAGAPVAALFAILTKVGVYAVLRLWTLLLSTEAGQSALFGAEALMWGGFATLAFASLGLLAAVEIRRLAGYSIILSSGTLLAVVGFGQASLIGAALYYLVGSTLAASTLFLISELVDRFRTGSAAEASIQVEDADRLPFYLERMDIDEDTNLDDEARALIGRAIPAPVAFLALAFMLTALLIAGLPPLSGFLAKVAMLTAAFGDAGTGAGAAPWLLLSLLLGSGLTAMIAMSRAGIRYFWAPSERPPPALRAIECTPIAALFVTCIGLAVMAGPVLSYANAAAEGVLRPAPYIESVMSATPVRRSDATTSQDSRK